MKETLVVALSKRSQLALFFRSVSRRVLFTKDEDFLAGGRWGPTTFSGAQKVRSPFRFW